MLKKFGLIIFSLLLFLPQGTLTAEETALERMRKESRTLADIVEVTQKGVVHIEVEKVLKAGISGTPYNNPFDLFNDRFFDQFFPGLRDNRRYPFRQPREFRQKGAGSGTIIDKEGHILTNNHVVGEADKIMVKLADGREYEARIVGTDPLSDIAVIKIDADNLPVVPMGNSDQMRIGETVIAIGNPFGLSNTVTMGIISAKGRSNVDIADYEDFIQTDAAINPGNSGGPLVNLKGEIIGVNTAIFTRSGGYQGIGFAVPINMARNVMDQLIEHGTVSRGWLGVLLQDIDNELSQALDLENSKGALVAEVTDGSPAEKAGLKQGDVIVRYGEKQIKNVDHLKNEVGLTLPDTTVELGIVRDGKPMELSVTLGSRPTKFASAGQPSYGGTNNLGLIVQKLTPELANQYGYQEYRGGVIITNLAPNSPAARAGLRTGHLILEINRQPVNSVSAFEEAVENASLKKGILLLVGTPNGARYLILKG